METLSRWPLLLGALGLAAVAVGVDLSSDAARGIAAVLMILAATCLGAFVYAEGARHRGWPERRETPRTEVQGVSRADTPTDRPPIT